jgi:hypothetical protein
VSSTKVRPSNVVKLRHSIQLPGNSAGVVMEEVLITPEEAAKWLEANHFNRPVREKHVKFLADQMRNGQWLLNGQAIIISDGEEILDGQHRLKAIIEAGTPVRSVVVYGIEREAFKTIDTGIVRTGGDALILHNPTMGNGICKAVAISVPWCIRLEQGLAQRRLRISNTDVLEYVKEHPSLWQCAEVLNGFARTARPLPLGAGVALYEVFARKHPQIADVFMANLFTGEMLAKKDPEYILRTAFLRDADNVRKYPMDIRMKMSIKAWNLRVRNTEATRQAIAIGPTDNKVVIY